MMIDIKEDLKVTGSLIGKMIGEEKLKEENL